MCSRRCAHVPCVCSLQSWYVGVLAVCNKQCSKATKQWSERMAKAAAKCRKKGTVCLRAKFTYFHTVRRQARKCIRKKGAARKACLLVVKKNRKIWYRKVKAKCRRPGTKKCTSAKKVYFRRVMKVGKLCQKAGTKRGSCIMRLQVARKKWHKRVVKACSGNVCFKKLGKRSKRQFKGVQRKCSEGLTKALAERKTKRGKLQKMMRAERKAKRKAIAGERRAKRRAERRRKAKARRERLIKGAAMERVLKSKLKGMALERARKAARKERSKKATTTERARKSRVAERGRKRLARERRNKRRRKEKRSKASKRRERVSKAVSKEKKLKVVVAERRSKHASRRERASKQALRERRGKALLIREARMKGQAMRPRQRCLLAKKLYYRRITRLGAICKRLGGAKRSRCVRRLISIRKVR